MITPCCASANPNAVHQSFNLSQGSFPPAEGGSGDFENFAPPRGVATPTGTTQFVTSSGPLWPCSWTKLLPHQAYPQSRQRRSSFWPAKQRSWGWRSCRTLSTCPVRRYSFTWVLSPLATRRSPLGALTISQLTTPSCTPKMRKSKSQWSSWPPVQEGRWGMAGDQLHIISTHLGIWNHVEWVHHQEQKCHWGLAWLQDNGRCWCTCEWWSGDCHSPCWHAPHYPDRFGLPLHCAHAYQFCARGVF